MNTPEVKAYIRQRAYLFWHIPDNKKEDISHELLVETILNYGNLDDVKNLFEIFGINYVKKIFTRSTKNKSRINYFRPVLNYFTLYFERNAQRNIDRKSN